MGNQATGGKAFKGEGNVLSTGEKVVNKKKQRPTKASKVPAKSSDDANLQRVLQTSAAEARANQWESKLKQKAQKREAARKEELMDDLVNANNNTNVNKPPPAELFDESVAQQLEKQAAILDSSGFNPYEVNVSSSASARTAITMNAEPQKTTTSTPAPKVDREEDQMNEAIKRSILSQERNGQELTEEQMVAQALQLSMEEQKQTKEQEQTTSTEQVTLNYETSFDLTRVQSRIRDIEDINDISKSATVLSTLLKLLNNLVNDLENPKFHTIKLSNTAIKTRLIDTANSAGKLLLVDLGFIEDPVAQVLSTTDNVEYLNTIKERSLLAIPTLQNRVDELKRKREADEDLKRDAASRAAESRTYEAKAKARKQKQNSSSPQKPVTAAGLAAEKRFQNKR